MAWRGERLSFGEIGLVASNRMAARTYPDKEQADRGFLILGECAPP